MKVQAADRILNALPAAESVRLFEDVLKTGATLRVRVTGRSMVPFLEGREILIIRKVPCSSVRKGDLIFFKNFWGDPVVHRVVKKRRTGNAGTTFQTKGDALTVPDEPVPCEEVLGKVCAVERGSRHVNLETGTRIVLNYLIAAIGLFESYLRGTVRTVIHSARVGGRRGGGP